MMFCLRDALLHTSARSGIRNHFKHVGAVKYAGLGSSDEYEEQKMAMALKRK
jgi:hypothetical protein